MGLQDEYLRNFTVLLTERGVIPLTDPMQIAIYNSLSGGMKRPNELVEELGVVSSSLHFVLDKMVESGVLVKSKPDPEKKSVYYSTLAVKIAGSFEPDESAKSQSEATFNQPSRYYKGLSSVANMLDAYTSEIGLEMDQMREDYANDLADSCRYGVGKLEYKDAIMAARELFYRMTDCRFSVFSTSPLVLIFEGSIAMRTKMDMMTQFISRVIENACGRTYAVTQLEDFSGEESAKIKVTFDRVEPEPKPYFNTSLPQTAAVDKFLMVELDGSAGIMTSNVQMDIVDTIYERPLCITDIVGNLNYPRSTITSNLLRLVEEGVVSVFYAESGSAYYGLSCSILMKKARNVSHDHSEIREILDGVSERPGSFMEGYLLYTLAKLKQLGFDAEYLMVVLGAKYMRAAGRTGPKAFDSYFGKVSDIAKAVGLSLNIVSIYPLTIGISSKDSESKVRPAMTFVKGMTHQGLELASDGIFVRTSDETPENRNISFKEIYPSLSMTPVEGIRVEQLADASATTKKKRTSSVKTALLRRSFKDSGKPARTVRYITALVMFTMVAGLLVFSAAGGDNVAADSYEVDLDPDSDVCLYDVNGNQIFMPFITEADTVLEFYTSDLPEGYTLGTVANGIAYALENDGGKYRLEVSDDMCLQELRPVSLPETAGYTAYLYCFADTVSEKTAYNFTGYIDASQYGTVSGGLYVNEYAYICLDTDKKYFSPEGDDGTFYWQKLVSDDSDLSDVAVLDLPENAVSITLEGDYRIDGRYVTGNLMVGMYKQVTGQLTNVGSSTVICTNESGKAININLTEGKFRLYTGNEDLTIRYIQGIL